MSDGSYDGDDPLEVIRDENQQLNNRVVIHTYGIGTGECNVLFYNSIFGAWRYIAI